MELSHLQRRKQNCPGIRLDIQDHGRTTEAGRDFRSPMGAGLGWKDGEGAVDGTKSESYVPCHLPRAQALSVSLSSNDM